MADFELLRLPTVAGVPGRLYYAVADCSICMMPRRFCLNIRPSRRTTKSYFYCVECLEAISAMLRKVQLKSEDDHEASGGSGLSTGYGLPMSMHNDSIVRLNTTELEATVGAVVADEPPRYTTSDIPLQDERLTPEVDLSVDDYTETGEE